MHQFSQRIQAVLEHFDRVEIVNRALQRQPIPADYIPERISIYANGGGGAIAIIEEGEVVFRDNSVDYLFEGRCPDLFEICFDGQTVYTQAGKEVVVNRIRDVGFILNMLQKIPPR
jgi:hypothetical protein